MPRTLRRRGAPQDVVTEASTRRAVREAERALNQVNIAYLPVEQIEEMSEDLNSRQKYDDESINELAASIREHGILQPICVRPDGDGYRLVFGMRRLKAAIRAGLKEVPATIRIADDDQSFLLNTIENLHRVQLSGPERTRAIERLAATNLGVLEMSRRTGFNQSTISRWFGISRRPALMAALEHEKLDLGRAMVLAHAPEPVVEDLLDEARKYSQGELRERVARARGLLYATPQTSARTRQLQQALGLIRLALQDGLPLEPEDEAVVREIQAQLRGLRRVLR